MQGRQRQNEQHHTHFVVRCMISSLALLLLVGCGGTSSTGGGTHATSHPTATSGPRQRRHLSQARQVSQLHRQGQQ